MWRVAKAATFEHGGVTLTTHVRRDLEAIERYECGCVKSRATERNVLLSFHHLDDHRDFERGGVRAIDIIAIEPGHIVDQTMHFEGAP